MILINIFIIDLGKILGKYAANKIINNNNNKFNLDKYYRELPNNFGIGVNTLLIDSKLEKEKDIVGVILDLCARKYLKLNCNNNIYEISILNNDFSKLNLNENYVMNEISNNNITKIDYNKWFDYCVQDGINYGLFNFNKKFKYKNESNKIKLTLGTTKYFLIFVIIAILFDDIINLRFAAIINKSIFILIALFILNLGLKFWSHIINKTMNFYNKSNYYIANEQYDKYAFSLLDFLLLHNGSFLSSFLKSMKEAYNLRIEEYLIPTKLGIENLQKLNSFKMFLSDFGNFSNKKPEEVILWDFYLSYAQLFGLTDSILDNGYNNLINTASFKINNMDIKLENIKVKY